jgi:pyruvate kinase
MLEGSSLIATLPNLSRTDKVHKVLSNPFITGARFNTGANQLMNIEEIVYILKQLSETYSKTIWIDIKGRQLRITKWADPSYEAIELNHNISITYPAKIYFRNGDCSNIVRTKGNKILVDPIPKHALGAGQSVNVLAKDLEIEGYLTDSDIEYLKLCNKYGMNHIMASFVEEIEDLLEIQKYHSKASIVSKIESLKGLKLIMEHELSNLMASREDLYVETGQDIRMLNHLKTIIEKR